MSLNALLPIIFGVIGLVVAYFIYQAVKKYPAGEAKVAAISDAIHLGAMVFMRREYKMLG
ncbi:MAG: sodium/proton-translocating pyrophosphatase, partial [Gammaproteobacteria bacterium]